MKKSFFQAVEPLVKVHAKIKSPKGQVISNFLSVGLDVLGILGIPAASSMSLAKDSTELIIQWISRKGVDKGKIMTVIHDISAFIPLYSQYQSLLAFSIDSAQLAAEDWYDYLKPGSQTESILDRLFSYAEKITLRGKSLRKKEK